MTVSEQLTAEEKSTLKMAAFGAVSLVSNADPGAFNMIRESFAASRALTDTAGLVKEVFTTGDRPHLPGDPEETELLVLAGLRRSVEILEAKVPRETDNYRRAVLAATEQVAGAVDGRSEAEITVMTKVRGALGVSA